MNIKIFSTFPFLSTTDIVEPGLKSMSVRLGLLQYLSQLFCLTEMQMQKVSNKAESEQKIYLN